MGRRVERSQEASDEWLTLPCTPSAHHRADPDSATRHRPSNKAAPSTHFSVPPSPPLLAPSAPQSSQGGVSHQSGGSSPSRASWIPRFCHPSTRGQVDGHSDILPIFAPWPLALPRGRKQKTSPHSPRERHNFRQTLARPRRPTSGHLGCSTFDYTATSSASLI